MSEATLTTRIEQKVALGWTADSIAAALGCTVDDVNDVMAAMDEAFEHVDDPRNDKANHRRQKAHERDQQLLTFIVEYTARHKIPPSNEEIGAHIGIHARTAKDWIARLAFAGYVTREPGKGRTVRVIRGDVAA